MFNVRLVGTYQDWSGENEVNIRVGKATEKDS